MRAYRTLIAFGLSLGLVHCGGADAPSPTRPTAPPPAEVEHAGESLDDSANSQPEDVDEAEPSEDADFGSYMEEGGDATESDSDPSETDSEDDMDDEYDDTDEYPEANGD